MGPLAARPALRVRTRDSPITAGDAGTRSQTTSSATKCVVKPAPVPAGTETHLQTVFSYSDETRDTQSIRLVPRNSHVSLQAYQLLLRKTSSLTTVKLIELHSCSTVDSNFCALISSLTTLELSGLVNCVRIRTSFCHGCTNLQSLTLSGLTRCEVIDDDFCHGCSSLTHLDLSSMPKCRTVGPQFCDGCTSLEYLDLSMMPTCFLIGNNASRVAPSVKALNLMQLVPEAPIQLAQLLKFTSLRVVHVHRELAHVLKSQGRPPFAVVIDSWPSYIYHHSSRVFRWLCCACTRV